MEAKATALLRPAISGFRREEKDMLTLNGLSLMTLVIAFGFFVGAWYGNMFPDENKARPKVYLCIGLAVAFLTSILIVVGVLHF
jgi:uncharacterized membrane protein